MVEHENVQHDMDRARLSEIASWENWAAVVVGQHAWPAVRWSGVWMSFWKGLEGCLCVSMKYAVGSGVERQVDARSQLLGMLL